MILKNPKTIFVHVNKAAGSSIEMFFGANSTDQHLVASEYIDKIGRGDWKKYYTFSFVRNPWDRIVSWYLWINRSAFWYNAGDASYCGSWNEGGYSLNVDFLSPAMFLGPQSHKRGVDLHGGHPQVKPAWYLALKYNFKNFLEHIDSANDLSLHQDIYKFGHKGRWVSNQVEWLKNNSGKVCVDFVGRVENIESDFQKVCGDLGVKYKKLKKVKKLNKRPHYSKFYDDETRKIVEKLYKKDIEYFNYDYHDES